MPSRQPAARARIVRNPRLVQSADNIRRAGDACSARLAHCAPLLAGFAACLLSCAVTALASADDALLLPLPLAAPSAAFVRPAPWGAGPRLLGLTAPPAPPALSARPAARFQTGQPMRSPGPGTPSGVYVDVLCDVFLPGKSLPRQWMSTSTIARLTADGYNYVYGYDPLAQSYDMLVSGYATSDGILAQETVGVAAAPIPAPITASNIRGVEFWFAVSEANLFPFERVGFTDLTDVTAPPNAMLTAPQMQALFDDARGFTGQVYYLDHVPVGAHALDLGALAVQDLAARVQTPGWFGVGMAADGWDLSGSLGELVEWRVLGGGNVSQGVHPFFRLYYNAPPDSFPLMAPSNGEQLSTSLPVLRWAAATDPNGDTPVTYTARLGSTPDLASAFERNVGSATQATVPFALIPGTYTWEVVARDPSGESRTSERWSFKLLPVVAAPPALQESSLALAASPNPFNPRTELQYALPQAGAVALWIADARGRRVASLLAQDQTAGAHRVRWDGNDAAGSACASGVYFAVLQTPSGTAHARLALVR
jgi:hypothetical protein